MKKIAVINYSILLVALLFASLIMGGYSNAKAGDALLNKWPSTMVGVLVDDKEVSRPVQVLTEILPGGNHAKVIFVYKSITHLGLIGSIAKNTLKFQLAHGANVICTLQNSGGAVISYVEPGGGNDADGTLTFSNLL